LANGLDGGPYGVIASNGIYSDTFSLANFLFVPTDTSIIGVFPDVSVVSETVAVSFTVGAEIPGMDEPTGVVTVSEQTGTTSCVGILSDGSGSCGLLFPLPGTYTVTASYGGDDHFLGSSDAVQHTITKADATLNIISITPDPSIINQSVVVSFSVTTTVPGIGTPGGIVNVSSGGAANPCIGVLGNGAGSCALTFSQAGVFTIQASYEGSSLFNESLASGEHTVIPIRIFLPIVINQKD